MSTSLELENFGNSAVTVVDIQSVEPHTVSGDRSLPCGQITSLMDEIRGVVRGIHGGTDVPNVDIKAPSSSDIYKATVPFEVFLEAIAERSSGPDIAEETEPLLFDTAVQQLVQLANAGTVSHDHVATILVRLGCPFNRKHLRDLVNLLALKKKSPRKMSWKDYSRRIFSIPTREYRSRFLVNKSSIDTELNFEEEPYGNPKRVVGRNELLRTLQTCEDKLVAEGKPKVAEHMRKMPLEIQRIFRQFLLRVQARMEKQGIVFKRRGDDAEDAFEGLSIEDTVVKLMRLAVTESVSSYRVIKVLLQFVCAEALEMDQVLSIMIILMEEDFGYRALPLFLKTIQENAAKIVFPPEEKGEKEKDDDDDENDLPQDVPSYPSDLTDAQWELIKDLIPPMVNRGQNNNVPARSIINAVRYRNAKECNWKDLPPGFPPKSDIGNRLTTWKKTNVLENIVKMLGE